MQVVSASRLSDGAVVYLDPQDNWAESLGAAAVLETESEIEAALRKAQAAAAANEIIDPFAVPVAKGADGLHAMSLRNAIRELGPTIAFRTSPLAATRS
jgi:hypothetical protein